jgi:hypothetical protein
MQIKKKNGFSILAIILVIVAVIVAIDILALSGQSINSSSADISTSILASTILNEFSDSKNWLSYFLIFSSSFLFLSSSVIL